MGKPLMTIKNTARQSQLESRLQSLWANGVAQDAVIGDIFGPLESWVLELGEQRLLLHPVQKVWLVYDRLHDAWQSTGIAPGEGVFVAQGRRLGISRAGAVTPAVSPSARTVMINPARCPDCGLPVMPTEQICSNCGKPLREETGHG